MTMRALRVTFLMPLAALAAATAQQELQDAMRAPPSLDRGAALFETCAACHGRSGTGTSDGDIPSIGGQHFKVIVKQLVEFQHGQRWDFRMSHFADQHHLTGPQAIADVAAYASSLPRPSWARVGVGEGQLVPHGEGVYKQLCASCHRPTGQGNGGTSVPQLAGQHFEYLRRQIYNAIDGERPGFPDSHVRLLKQLQHDDIDGVADYLARLPPRRPAGHRASGDADLLP
jgi:cytochrome c553